jgi:hypothetical protein
MLALHACCIVYASPVPTHDAILTAMFVCIRWWHSMCMHKFAILHTLWHGRGILLLLHSLHARRGGPLPQLDTNRRLAGEMTLPLHLAD